MINSISDINVINFYINNNDKIINIKNIVNKTGRLIDKNYYYTNKLIDLFNVHFQYKLSKLNRYHIHDTIKCYKLLKNFNYSIMNVNYIDFVIFVIIIQYYYYYIIKEKCIEMELNRQYIVDFLKYEEYNVHPNIRLNDEQITELKEVIISEQLYMLINYESILSNMIKKYHDVNKKNIKNKRFTNYRFRAYQSRWMI